VILLNCIYLLDTIRSITGKNARFGCVSSMNKRQREREREREKKKKKKKRGRERREKRERERGD
jgi:hypothetical protein